MPRVEPPPIKTEQLPDIQLFAKAYFNIELTSWQLQFAGDVIKQMRLNTNRRKAGVNTVEKVIKAYIAEGIKPHGRSRIIDRPVPPMIDREKFKALTQEGKILHLIKRPGGAMNFELSRVSLRYGASVFNLRKDGYDIITERQYLKNGRASNTYRYRMAGQ